MRFLKTCNSLILAICVSLAFVHLVSAKPSLYMSDTEFLTSVFGDSAPPASALIVASELRQQVEDILDHRFAGLRLKYWQHGEATAWILDEIGKTEPITIGVSIDAGRVSSVRVLEYRESRGSEVRFAHFTDQFLGAVLEDGTTLDRPIDGITGATLSVNAVQKIVRVALLLDEHVKTAGRLNASASY